MLESVKGYYNGSQIVVDDKEMNKLEKGQELIITFFVPSQQTENRAEKRRKFLKSKEYVIPSGRNADEIDLAIREMRDNDRI